MVWECEDDICKELEMLQNAALTGYLRKQEISIGLKININNGTLCGTLGFIIKLVGYILMNSMKYFIST